MSRKIVGRCLGLRRVRNYATSFHNFSQNYFTSFSSSQSGEADLRTGVVSGSEKTEADKPAGRQAKSFELEGNPRQLPRPEDIKINKIGKIIHVGGRVRKDDGRKPVR